MTLPTRSNGDRIDASWFNDIKSEIETNELGLPSYADDSAFVTAKGSAAANADRYYNTTTNLVRYYSNGAWSSYVDDDSAQTLTNKTIAGTLSDSFAIGDGTDTNKSMTANNGDANSPAVRYNATNNEWEFSNDGVNYSGIGSGTGSTVNYLSDNYDFENDIDGFDTESDNTKFDAVHETTSPLRGSGSLKLDKKSGTDCSTEYIESDIFTIDETDQHSMIAIKFDASTSANYVDDDVKVEIYDVENSTTIAVNDESIKAGEYGTYYGVFQTAPFGGGGTEGQYKLRFTIDSTSTALYSLLIDNISVGPQNIVYGAPITVWEEYTPTLTSFTASSTETQWRRVGDTAEVKGYIVLNGAPSGVLQVSMPNGLVANSDFTDSRRTHGDAIIQRNDPSGFTYTGAVDFNSITTAFFFRGDQTAQGGLWNAGIPTTLASGDVLSFSFSIPITGWSSNVAMSETISNREISVIGRGNGGTSITANVTDIDFTETKDTISSWNGSVFTAPKTGDYLINGIVYLTASAGPLFSAYIDGVIDKTLASFGLSTTMHHFSGVITLEKDEGLSIRSNTSVTLSNSTDRHHISIIGLNNNSQTIAASEKVIAIYKDDSGQAFTNGNTMTFNTKVKDSHGALASGVFTCPKSGDLTVIGGYTVDALAVVAAESWGSELFINSTSVERIFEIVFASTTVNLGHSFQYSYPVNKGDTVEIKFNETVTSAGTLISSTDIFNFVSFEID